MIIEKISLKGFRNYLNSEFIFQEGINFITGKNGIGKTNIVEAISVISSIKSFKNAKDEVITKRDSDYYYCSADLKEQNFQMNVEAGYDKNNSKKKIKVNGKEICNFSDFYGKVITVFFTPDDVYILTESPDKRRKYFDSVISKYDNYYLRNILEYKKIIKTRNLILKEIREKNRKRSDLDIWNRMFSEKTEKIVNKRIQFSEIFNNIFSAEYKKISEYDAVPVFSYKSDFKNFNENDIYNFLGKNIESEIYAGFSKFGPHKDDYLFQINGGEKFIDYASQGQKRTAALAIKNTEKDIVEKEKCDLAIIIVDDCFADLDMVRRHNLIKALSEKNQLIVTTVSLELMEDVFKSNSHVINLGE